MAQLIQDLRFAIRMLVKNPGFTGVAVLTLALCIGANTAIFSVVNAVLLRPLPYADPQRIVMLWTDNPAYNVGFHELPPTPLDLREWQRDAKSFEQVVGFRNRTADLSEQGDPERVGGVQVTAGFFSVLGVQPLQGRTFLTQEEQPGHGKIAIISYALWQRRFAGGAQVVGKSITVNHERRVVVGIMPRGFSFPRGAEMPAAYGVQPHTEIWMPYVEDAHYWQGDDTRDFIAMGRLKADVAVADAQAEMTILAQREAKQFPQSHAGWVIHVQPLAAQVTGKTQPILLTLFGAVAFVLLIACANVANLQLCRSVGRRQEMAVRAAIGAGRGRILRQLLTESALLSLLGGALGLLLGMWAVRAIIALSPQNIPRLAETTLDTNVLTFTLFISMLSGIAFGLAPALQTSKINLSESLKAGGRTGGPAGRYRPLRLLITGEVALAVVLLSGAGLLIQSFLKLSAVNPGFQPHQVLAFDVGLFAPRYQGDERVRQFFRDARRQLSQVPGIRSVGATSNLPLAGSENLDFFFVEGAALPTSGSGPTAENRLITPGYLQTMEITLLRGRDFSDRDTADAPAVCIVNETMARDYFPGGDRIGKRLKIGGAGNDVPWRTIVGITRDVRGYALDSQPRPQVCTPIEQTSQNEMTFVVRGDADSTATLQRAVQTEMKLLDPTLPLANLRTMDNVMSSAVDRPRFSTWLLGSLALTALLLTAIGLYGVVAFAANQRTRENGIRMALGATRHRILLLTIRQGMLPVVGGLVLGTIGALTLTRVLASQLYQIKPTDPITMLAVCVLLLSVAVAACWLPARRAARVDPMVALRYE